METTVDFIISSRSDLSLLDGPRLWCPDASWRDLAERGAQTLCVYLATQVTAGAAVGFVPTQSMGTRNKAVELLTEFD